MNNVQLDRASNKCGWEVLEDELEDEVKGEDTRTMITTGNSGV